MALWRILKLSPTTLAVVLCLALAAAAVFDEFVRWFLAP